MAQQKITLEANVRKLQAEVGPIRYVSQLIYGSTDNDSLERAVRILTSVIVLVFDPLAIILVVCSNIGRNYKKFIPTIKNSLHIDSDII